MQKLMLGFLLSLGLIVSSFANEIAGIEYIENHRTGTKERNIVAIDTRNFIYMRNLSSNLWNR